nr:unnamed protein product [Naegleria fowleri]
MEWFKQELESCFGQDKFWMNFYVLVSSMIPIQCANLHHRYQVVKPPIYPSHYGFSEEADEEDSSDDETHPANKPNNDDCKVSEKHSTFIKQDFIHGKKYDWDNEDIFVRRLVSLNYVYFSVYLTHMKKRICNASTSNDLSQQENEKRKKILLDALQFDIKTHKICTLLSIFDRHGIILRYFGSDLENTQKLVWESSEVLEEHIEAMTSPTGS